MQITLLAIGTRGDVQPLLALAVGLQRTGRHSVRLIVPDDFGGLVVDHGVEHCPLGMDARTLLGSGPLAAGLESFNAGAGAGSDRKLGQNSST